MLKQLSLKGKNVTVMGLGLFGGGVGLTRFLARQGAKITVSDIRKESELAESLAALKEFPSIIYKLGKHQDSDFANADLVVVNPAVPKDSHHLELIRQKGIPVETEMNLFFKLCPCPIIGITGSNGKTTTLALLNEMIKNTARRTCLPVRQVWLGGNIGYNLSAQNSLLVEIDQIQKDDLALLELSSFQLEDLAEIKKSPFISITINIRPNHLDRHKTMENYIHCKKNIIRYQDGSSYTVLNLDDDEVRGWNKESPGKVLYFSHQEDPSAISYLKDGRFYLRDKETMRQVEICRSDEARLIGTFNQENILAALVGAHLVGARPEDMARAIRTFPGVEHRLEFVAEINGVKYYNDSIATNPDATIAALSAIKGPIILIAGGYDKGLPFDDLIDVILQRTKAVVLIGVTAGKIDELIRRRKSSVKIIKPARRSGGAVTLEEAVLSASQEARTEDAVLLSPACASYDMFRNFAERGRIFKQAVKELTHRARLPVRQGGGISRRNDNG